MLETIDIVGHASLTQVPGALRLLTDLLDQVTAFG